MSNEIKMNMVGDEPNMKLNGRTNSRMVGVNRKKRDAPKDTSSKSKDRNKRKR